MKKVVPLKKWCALGTGLFLYSVLQIDCEPMSAAPSLFVFPHLNMSLALVTVKAVIKSWWTYKVQLERSSTMIVEILCFYRRHWCRLTGRGLLARIWKTGLESRTNFHNMDGNPGFHCEKGLVRSWKTGSRERRNRGAGSWQIVYVA